MIESYRQRNEILSESEEMCSGQQERHNDFKSA